MAIMQKAGEMIKEIMDISPEKYYFDELRPCMVNVAKNVKYDNVFTSAIELAMNHADGHAAKKQYSLLNEDLNPLSYVLLDSKSQYRKEKPYVSASDEEKAIVDELGDKISQLCMIIKYSKEPEESDIKEPRKRIGYDNNKKENAIGKRET